MKKCEKYVDVSIRLNFSGNNFDPREITAKSGIAPNESWIVGDEIKATPGLIQKAIHKRKNCGWQYYTNEVDLIYGFDLLIDNFYKKFMPVADILNILCKTKNIETNIEIVGYVGIDKSPSVYLSKNFILLCNKLEANLGVCMYLS